VSPERNDRFTEATQRGPETSTGIGGTIAAAGRSGVEDVYGVPYWDVECDV
jgi:hypothetical protein